MRVFKIGDKVRTIDDEINNHPLGSEFVVAYVDIDDDGDVFVGNKEDGEAAWFSWHFELAQSAPKFNIGDKIIMTAANSRFYAVGDIGIVTNAADYDGHVWAKFPHHDFDCCLGSINRVGYDQQAELYVEPFAAEPRRYKVGDIVQVLKSDWPVEIPVGSMFTVEEVNSLTNGVSLYVDFGFAEKNECYFFASEVKLILPIEDQAVHAQFELTTDEPVLLATEVKPTLYITYGGVTISLDTNAAFSRQFADTMLDQVYN